MDILSPLTRGNHCVIVGPSTISCATCIQLPCMSTVAYTNRVHRGALHPNQSTSLDFGSQAIAPACGSYGESADLLDIPFVSFSRCFTGSAASCERRRNFLTAHAAGDRRPKDVTRPA